MALKKMKIVCRPRGSRGTAQAQEMVEMMQENWAQIRENYNSQSAEDQDDMIEHFNSAVENLGDNIFGDESNPQDFERFIQASDEATQEKFLQAVKEVLDIELKA